MVHLNNNTILNGKWNGAERLKKYLTSRLKNGWANASVAVNLSFGFMTSNLDIWKTSAKTVNYKLL